MNVSQPAEKNDTATFYTHHSNEYTERRQNDYYEQHSPVLNKKSNKKVRAVSGHQYSNNIGEEPMLNSDADVHTIPIEDIDMKVATNSLPPMDSEIA